MRPEEMRVAYVSSIDPLNKKAWSGSHFSIYSAFKKKFKEVDVLGPYRPSLTWFISKCKHAFAKMIGKRFDYPHSRAISKAYAEYFDKRLSEKKYDLIIAPAGSSEIAHLKTDIPIIYVSDATVKASLNYHKALSNLTQASQEQSIETEELAMRKSILSVFTTSWAGDSAIKDSSIDARKVAVIPFGPNFEETPSRGLVEKKQKGTVCKLLFVGVNWMNKGGPIALNVLTKLLSRGIDAELTVCGCVPGDEYKHDHMRVIPFLDKSDPVQRKQLYKLYDDASFLILPTRFEAYGLVFCEASAYGLISLATRTGGVPGVVSEGKNGFLFDPHDEGEGYAEIIIQLWNDPEKYKTLSLSSRAEFETRLNWDRWMETLLQRLEPLLTR